MLTFSAERWEAVPLSSGGLWEDVTPLQNINFKADESEIKTGGGGGKRGWLTLPESHIFVCVFYRHFYVWYLIFQL